MDKEGNFLCKDIIHDALGNYAIKYNYMGNVLLFFQLSLVLIVILSKKPKNISKYIILWIVLMVLREITYKCTKCKIDTGDKVLMGSNKWYIISGHTLTTMILTTILLESKVDIYIKLLSIVLSACIILFQVSTKEHKTTDIIVTVFLTYFAIRSIN